MPTWPRAEAGLGGRRAAEREMADRRDGGGARRRRAEQQRPVAGPARRELNLQIAELQKPEPRAAGPPHSAAQRSTVSSCATTHKGKLWPWTLPTRQRLSFRSPRTWPSLQRLIGESELRKQMDPEAEKRRNISNALGAAAAAISASRGGGAPVVSQGIVAGANSYNQGQQASLDKRIENLESPRRLELKRAG